MRLLPVPSLLRVLARSRFPYAPPTWPGGVPLPQPERRTCVAYDTSWARR